MVIGVRQRAKPRASSSTLAAQDAQKRWWPQGTSAWRASRSSTRQTSHRSGGCMAADGETLLLAVGTSLPSSVSSESDCSIASHFHAALCVVRCQEGAPPAVLYVKTCTAEPCHPWNLLSWFICYGNRSRAATFVCSWFQCLSFTCRLCSLSDGKYGTDRALGRPGLLCALMCTMCLCLNCVYSCQNWLWQAWRSIVFLFPNFPVPHFPVSHFQRPR